MSRVQLLLRGGSRLASPLQSSSNSPIISRLEPFPRSATRPPRSTRASTRASSTSTSSAVSSEQNDNDTSSTPTDPATPNPPADNEKQKSKKPVRKVLDSKEQRENSSILPPGLNVFWNCADWEPSSQSDLPPEEILNEALNNLLICLHPQAQRRSLYSTASGSGPVEPTLALYCPIEGGDYLLDNTVQELARRTHSEVLVLDSLQLAAGEWGCFGDANTLDLSSVLKIYPPLSSQTTNKRQVNDDEEDETDGFGLMSPQSMTIHVSGLIPPTSRTRQAVIAPSQRNTLANRRKVFFEEVVNLPSPDSVSESPSSSSESSTRSRIIYIRDYHTIASSRHTWFNPLLSAVRARRQGPINRASSPVAKPIVIIYGITPPLIGPSNVTSVLSASPSRNGEIDSQWSESSSSQRARERRLRERLNRWKSGAFNVKHELPPSPQFSPLSDGNGSSDHTQLVVVPVNGGLGGILGNMANVGQQMGGRSSSNEDGDYYRTSVIVPKSRQISLEKESRTERRLMVNDIVVRMAIGSVGGRLPDVERLSLGPDFATPREEDGTKAATHNMLTQWSNHLQEWLCMKEIADRAVGSAISSSPTSLHAMTAPTPVSWNEVFDAWDAQQSAAVVKKAWIEDTLESKEGPSSSEEQSSEPNEPFDEVFDSIKQDPNLTTHERRLLGCFVSPNLMTTTFSQVHLPPHTIDSVRSIISLPLLHPQAFTRGILKEHAMAGALLFGPPGTGKTLLARALAKESGARMMLIKPSDVMDMYVGEGEKLVRSVFTLARRMAPCILFLDEIDALLGARVTSRDTGGAFAMRGVITEFMQEMDGLTTSQEQRVVVIGATNRPFDLDDAVLRRLPRRLLISLPDVSARTAILKIILRDELLTDDIDLQEISKLTEGFSGSDLKHLCVSAALDAVKQTVSIPWQFSRESSTTANSTTGDNSHASEHQSYPRTLSLSNFKKALKEITPSASETHGSVAELKKWNDLFGEGVKDRKHKLWGAGRFGFTNAEPPGST